MNQRVRDVLVFATIAGSALLLAKGCQTDRSSEGSPRTTSPAPVATAPSSVATAPVETAPSTAAAPSAESDEEADARPPAGERRFSWELAQWDFRKPGAWIMDTSGGGHHARAPLRGAVGEFFGLQFDGTGYVEVKDSPELALDHLFTMTIEFRPVAAPTREVILAARTDGAGNTPWELALLPGYRLRLTLRDADGKVQSVSTDAVPLEKHGGMRILATYDPKQETAKLFANCKLVGDGLVTARPRLAVDPASAKVTLVGQRGKGGLSAVMQSISLQRGVMEPTPGENCGFSMRFE